ncbi:hypothetical protein HDU76_007228, partial [Blyttiomyces sp. JEL0837]
MTPPSPPPSTTASNHHQHKLNESFSLPPVPSPNPIKSTRQSSDSTVFSKASSPRRLSRPGSAIDQPPSTLGQVNDFGQLSLAKKVKPPIGYSNKKGKDTDLISSLSGRLAKLEHVHKVDRSEIQQKDSQIRKLEKEVSLLKSCITSEGGTN